jgi:hypothetical protein
MTGTPRIFPSYPSIFLTSEISMPAQPRIDHPDEGSTHSTSSARRRPDDGGGGDRAA